MAESQLAKPALDDLVLAAVMRPKHPYELQPNGDLPPEPAPSDDDLRMWRSIRASRPRLQYAFAELRAVAAKISQANERPWLVGPIEDLENVLRRYINEIEQRYDAHMRIRLHLVKRFSQSELTELAKKDPFYKWRRPIKKGRPPKDGQLARVVLQWMKADHCKRFPAAKAVAASAMALGRKYRGRDPMIFQRIFGVRENSRRWQKQLKHAIKRAIKSGYWEILEKKLALQLNEAARQKKIRN
ncbi:MAG TPA: hypothetical protein VES67_06100 [Vicinamibacterales bacterium]|nr:hypothetical protein [Vicinamibacterales bacterium]